MKIQPKSDMHHEFVRRYEPGIHEAYKADKSIYNPRFINPEAQVLVLAGDIINASSDEHLAELKAWTTSLPIPVIYVPGNHDYWDTTPDFNLGIEGVNKKIVDTFKDTNVHFLNNDYVVIGDTVFVGGTLWTDLKDPLAQAAHPGWIDFWKIKGFTLDQWQRLHNECLNKIEQVLKLEQFREMKRVVVTHHLPSNRSSPERFRGSLDNAFFLSNQENLILDLEPNLWIHGHTHDSFDYEIDGTRIVCNPYGYFPSQVNPFYKRDSIVEI